LLGVLFYAKNRNTITKIVNSYVLLLNQLLFLRYVFKGDKIKPFIDGSMSFMGNIGHHTQFRNHDLTTTSNLTPKSFILSPSMGAGVMVNPSKKIYLTFIASYSMQIGYVYKMNNNKNELEKLRFNGINTQLAIGYNF
jgi:hypothetical protein